MHLSRVQRWQKKSAIANSFRLQKYEGTLASQPVHATCATRQATCNETQSSHLLEIAPALGWLGAIGPHINLHVKRTTLRSTARRRSSYSLERKIELQRVERALQANQNHICLIV